MGFYSIATESKYCKLCPESALNCTGGSHIILRQGFWRKNIYSDEIEYCKNNPSNCLSSDQNFNCAEGHYGALCGNNYIFIINFICYI